MEWQGKMTAEGVVSINANERESMRRFAIEHGACKIKFIPVLRESSKLRRWYEGGLVPLIAYYQEGFDHKNPDDRRRVREWLKAEFNGEIVELGGVAQKIAKSTAGRIVFYPFVDRVQDWFIANYEPPAEAMDPERFKYWRDAVRSFTNGPTNYIDYLIECGIL